MPLPTPGRIFRTGDPYHRSAADRFRRVSFHRSTSVNLLIQDSSLPVSRATGPGPSSGRSTKEAGAMAGPWMGARGMGLLGRAVGPLISARFTIWVTDTGSGITIRQPRTRRRRSSSLHANPCSNANQDQHSNNLAHVITPFRSAHHHGELLSPRWSRSSDCSNIPVECRCRLIGQSNCCEPNRTGTDVL
jgi:hypothetical protein